MPSIRYYTIRSLHSKTDRTCPVCIKIEIHEIHEIHQNLRNPVSINRNPPSATKSTSTEQKLIIEIHAFAHNQ